MHDLLGLETVNVGRFVGELVAGGFCGFIRLTAKGHELYLIFDSGQFQGGRLDGAAVAAGSEAAAVKPFVGAGATVRVVEIPAAQAPVLAIVYFGREVFADLPARMVNLTELVNQYHAAIRNGVLVLAHKKLGAGLVTINNGKWNVATDRGEFGKLYGDADSKLTLYSSDDVADPPASTNLDAFIGALSVSAAGAAAAIAAVLENAYPGKVGALRDWVEREYRGPGDLERTLAHIREYVELFIGGRGRDLDKIGAEVRARVAAGG